MGFNYWPKEQHTNLPLPKPFQVHGNLLSNSWIYIIWHECHKHDAWWDGRGAINVDWPCKRTLQLWLPKNCCTVLLHWTSIVWRVWAAAATEAFKCLPANWDNESWKLGKVSGESVSCHCVALCIMCVLCVCVALECRISKQKSNKIEQLPRWGSESNFF